MVVTESDAVRAMTLTEVVRYNLKRLRGKESRRAVAERIAARTGDPSWNQWLIYDIEGRKDRERSIGPDEMLALAITYDVSLVELMTPPDKIDNRPVRIRVGRDQVSPELFFRLAFLLGPEWRQALGDFAHHGRDNETGQLSESTSSRFVADVYLEALGVLLPNDADWQEWIGVEDNFVALARWVADNYGFETAWKISSDRMRYVALQGEGEEE